MFQLTVYTKKDFSDQSLLEFISENKNIAIKEYSQFLSKKKLDCNLAENLISFICSYDNGFLKPDKCDAHEPVHEKFDENNLANPIRWLSQPGGAFYFKKTKGFKIEGVIENLRFPPIWEDGNLMEPKVAESIYKGEVKLFFGLKLVEFKTIDYCINLIENICKILDTDFGLLTTYEEFSKYYNKEVSEKKIIISDEVKSIFSNSKNN